MAVYILSTVLSVSFAWLSAKSGGAQVDGDAIAVKSTRNLSSRFFAFLSFLPLFIVSALRYGIAFDYLYTYVPEYYKVVAGTSSHYEIGFFWLNKFVNAVFHNVDWLFVITSFAFLILAFFAIYRHSVNIPLSIFLLIGTRMYYVSFGQIRQYIVIAVFLCAINYIAEKKFVKYVVVILFAASIHTLALAFLPVYFLCRKRLSRKTYIAIGILAPIVTPLLQIVMNFFAKIFYADYVSTNFGINDTSGTMITLTLIVFVLTIFYYEMIPQSAYNSTLINLQLIAWVVAISTIGISESYRLLALFAYSSILLLPVILNAENNKYKRFLLLSAIVIMYSIATIKYLTPGNYMLPYRTIFSH